MYWQYKNHFHVHEFVPICTCWELLPRPLLDILTESRPSQPSGWPNIRPGLAEATLSDCLRLFAAHCVHRRLSLWGQHFINCFTYFIANYYLFSSSSWTWKSYSDERMRSKYSAHGSCRLFATKLSYTGQMALINWQRHATGIHSIISTDLQVYNQMTFERVM